nr:MAG TPA: Neurohypophysial hormone [Caudoviricetes sp.]
MVRNCPNGVFPFNGILVEQYVFYPTRRRVLALYLYSHIRLDYIFTCTV